MTNRLEVLDSIRGLAALVVVIYHFTYRYYQLYPQESKLIFSFYEGKYGVQAFFILSGFVIFMTLNRIEKPIDFIVSRFSRLYPVFWFCVITTFMIVSIFGLPNREVSLSDMIINLSMIAGQFGIPSVDGVYWTLIYELKFYFWIFILYFFNNLKNIERVVLIFLILVLLMYILNFEELLFFKIIKHIFIVDYMAYFISGILFYKIYKNEHTKLTFVSLLLAFFLSIKANTYDNGLVVIPIIYGIFLLFSLGKLNWFSNKFLTYLGTISYSLYLLHQNIGYILLNYFYKLNLNPSICFILSFILVIFLATIVSYTIEKKSTAYIKNMYKLHKQKFNKTLELFRFTRFLTKVIK